MFGFFLRFAKLVLVSIAQFFLQHLFFEESSDANLYFQVDIYTYIHIYIYTCSKCFLTADSESVAVRGVDLGHGDGAEPGGGR